MNLVTKPVIPVTQPYQSAVHELNEIKRYGTKRYDLLRYGNDSLNRETKKSEKIDRRQPIRILEHILKDPVGFKGHNLPEIFTFI